MVRKTISANRDPVLQVLESKTKDWNRQPFPESTGTKLTPKPRELGPYAALFTLNEQTFSWRDGYPSELEIIPESTYNTLVVESEIGNSKDGTGHAVSSKEIEEGNPNHIPPESLENQLDRLYRKTRFDSFDEFVGTYVQANFFDARRHIKDMEITTRRGLRRRPKETGVGLFLKKGPTKKISHVQETKSSRLQVPTREIQKILRDAGENLMGDNSQNGEDKFRCNAFISVINETWRQATPDSTTREHFRGYQVGYEIQFNSPSAGSECSLKWGMGLNRPDIRRYRRRLLKEATLLNRDYNEAFNNPDAVSIPSGEWEAYLEPESFSLQIHEAIIHSCTADVILGHMLYPDDEEDEGSLSFTLEDMNTLVGNKNLTITINPKKKNGGGELYWGGYLFDHQLAEPRKFDIIRNGKLSGLLSDRHTAYVINKLFGEETAYPGNSRFGVTRDEGEIESQQPRTSVMTVNWKQKYSRDALWNKFLRRIRHHGREYRYKNKLVKAGLWFKRTPHGEYTEEGYARGYNNLVNLVFEDGRYVPVRDFVYTSESPRRLLSNILGVGSAKEHLTGNCGAGEDGRYRVRESILSGPGIISNIEVRKSPSLPRRTSN